LIGHLQLAWGPPVGDIAAGEVRVVDLLAFEELADREELRWPALRQFTRSPLKSMGHRRAIER